MLPLIADRSQDLQTIYQMRMKALSPRDDSDAATLVPTKAEQETEKWVKDVKFKDQNEIEHKVEDEISRPVEPS